MLKNCVMCGVDCSTKPRVKDPHGRYYCQPCFDSANAKNVKTRAATDSGDEPFRLDDPAFEDNAPPAGQAHEDIIPLAPVEVRSGTPAPCQKCGSSWMPGAMACVVCGTAPGEKKKPAGGPKPGAAKAKPGKPVPCAKCGYDLRGLRSFHCPECGHKNPASIKPSTLSDTSREVARQAYTKPLIWMAVGLVVTTFVDLGRGEYVSLAVSAVMFPITVILAYATLWVLCAVWLGMTSSALLMLVQVAAIHGIIMGVASVMDLTFTPGIFKLVLYGVIYVYLLTEWMDMDSMDARMAAAGVYITQCVCVVLLLMLAKEML